MGVVTTSDTPIPTYPVEWEADVVLRDGRTARIRPITPADAEGLRSFHAQLSPETIYFRFFAPHPALSDAEVARFTHVDSRDRVALVVVVRGDIVGVGRFDRIGTDSAEVAFVIRDDYQGRGVGSLLLEHLAAAGRERGIHRFVAEVLPQNTRMLATFKYAGYTVAQGFADGVVSLEFAIEPNAAMDNVRLAREQRSEARSLTPLLSPQTIAIVGASRKGEGIGHALVLNLISGGFAGRIFVVHPSAEQILGVTCVPNLRDIQSPVDLVIVAVPAEDVARVVQQAAEVSAGGVVVVSGGFDASSAPIHDLGALARHSGMRLVGPAALGIINTKDGIRMNASLITPSPPAGHIGFFCQSGALGADIVRRMTERHLGLSNFVSAGHRADVSGNDLLQYWAEDDDTDIVLMYLETLGNPRKFARLAARVAQHKPVILLRTEGATGYHPHGKPARSQLVAPQAVDSIIAESGVIEVDSIDQLLDVAEVISHRGLLTGSRLGVVGNSEALAILARNAAEKHGLVCSDTPRTMARGSSPDLYRRHLDEALRDENVDVVLALYVPPIESRDDLAIGEVISQMSSGISKPVIAVVMGWGVPRLRATEPGRRGVRPLPVFTDVEHAVAAIGRVVAYTRYLAAESQSGRDESRQPPLGVNALQAREVVAEALIKTDAAVLDTRNSGEGDLIQEIMTCYGLAIGSSDLPEVDSVTSVACRIRAVDDPVLGRVVSFRLSGPIARVLEQPSYALAPVSHEQARAMVRSSAAIEVLAAVADPGPAVVDLAGLISRVAALIHDVPQIVEIVLDPVLTGASSTTIVHARLCLSVRGTDRGWATRSLTALKPRLK